MSDRGPVVIAHRGASGYLPEHTLPAKALAWAMGADYLEQDLVATRDDRLVVMHDVHLDRTTDVAQVYPERARPDGRWYVRDFDLAELSELRAHERVDATGAAVYPQRYPVGEGHFRVHSFDEELEFVARLRRHSDRPVGIYPELKRPAWHRQEGVDIAALAVDLLTQHGYADANDDIYLQCFDPAELVRLRDDFATQLPLVQLIASNDWGEADADFDSLQSADGLKSIADYADAIGPWIPQLYVATPSGPTSSGLVERAKAAGLAVHPYTFRSDDLPAGFADFETLLRFVVDELAVDGLFTDFPDFVRQWLAVRDGLS